MYVNPLLLSLLHTSHCLKLHHYLPDHQLQHVPCEHYCGSFSRDGAEAGWHLSFMLTLFSFVLSFQVLFDMAGMMVLISVNVSGWVRDGLLCASLLYSILLIVIFHSILPRLHIVVLFSHGLYAHVSGCLIRGRFQPMLVSGASYTFLHVHKTTSTNLHRCFCVSSSSSSFSVPSWLDSYKSVFSQ